MTQAGRHNLNKEGEAPESRVTSLAADRVLLVAWSGRVCRARLKYGVKACFQ